MKVTIYDYKSEILEFNHVESIAEVGVESSASYTRGNCDNIRFGIVITLDLEYSIVMGISYIQFFNRADFSRIEIH